MVGELYRQVNRMPLFFWMALFGFTVVGAKVLPEVLATSLSAVFGAYLPTF